MTSSNGLSQQDHDASIQRILQYTYGGVQVSGIDSYLFEADRAMQDPSLVFDYLYRYASPLRGREQQLPTKDSTMYELGIAESSNVVLKQLQEVFRLFRFFAKHRYDVIEINMTSTFMCLQASIIARLFGTRTRILHAHDSAVVEGRMKRVLKNAFTPLLRLSATNYWACSADAASYLFGSSFATQGNWELVRNGVHVENFRFNSSERDRLRSELSIESCLTIGVVGRFVEQKNQKFAVDVFNELHRQNPNTRLVFVGAGTLMDEVRGYAAMSEASRDIQFTGPRSDIPALLSAFDVLLAPSLHEGFPVVAVEAQAAGLPIVASTAFPAESDIIGAMRRIRLDSPIAEWAQAIDSLPNLDREDAAESVQGAGFDRSATAARLEELYRQLQASRRQRSR